MKCSSCGKEVRVGARFCRHCGVSMEQEREAQVVAQAPPQSVSDGEAAPLDLSPIQPLADLTMPFVTDSTINEAKCPQCGHSVKSGKGFCGECGRVFE